jgi:hypothetical protein
MRWAAPIAVTWLLAGCSILENDVERGYERSTLGLDPAVYTTADIRIVTLRPHPMNPNIQIECAEPSPDVAKALAAAVQVSANVADKGSGSFTGSAAEALAELAGRSTALLGLRDGLFRTCEAYANGAIGDTAYALVLARYGQLMTTLFLGQDVAAKAGASATLGSQGYPSGYNVNITGSGTSGAAPDATANQPKQPAAAPKKDAGAPAAAALSADPGEAERVAAEQIANGKLRRASFNHLIQLASLDAGDATIAQQGAGHHGRVGGAAGAPAATPSPAPALGASVSSPAPTLGCTSTPGCSPTTLQTNGKTVKTKTTTPTKMTAQPAPLPSSEAAALYEMNRDFLHLSASHLLLVACLNEYDETRIAKGVSNLWLRDKCNRFINNELLAQ